MKRRLKKETKRLEKHGTGHSASRSFTIGLLSGMSQLDYRHSQFPVTFLYIAQNPPLAGFFMVGLFGFEPKTSSMSTKRSNQLSYNPMSDECIIHDMREICKMLFAISCIWGVTDAVSTLQFAILLWIAVSSIDAAEHLLQNPSIRTPKSKQVQELLLCTCPQIVCTWRYLRNQNSLYKRIPRLAESCKSGVFVEL